jgi:hypothetical protein
MKNTKILLTLLVGLSITTSSMANTAHKIRCAVKYVGTSASGIDTNYRDTVTFHNYETRMCKVGVLLLSGKVVKKLQLGKSTLKELSNPQCKWSHRSGFLWLNYDFDEYEVCEDKHNVRFDNLVKKSMKKISEKPKYRK